MENNTEANASVATKRTGKELLTCDTCVLGHDIRDKATSIAVRKRYGKQAGQVKYTCLACENDRQKEYKRNGVSDLNKLIRLIRSHPELVEVLTKVAKATITK
jgi:hypothetical protein